MRTPNIGKQHLRAVLASRSQRAHLLQAEIDWPGSRALLERFAAGLGACYATDTLLRDRLNLHRGRRDLGLSRGEAGAETRSGALRGVRRGDRRGPGIQRSMPRSPWP